MPSELDLKGVRIAITGGTSGLGLALVRRLSWLGARVAFVARTAADVEHTGLKTGALGIVGDVGRKEDIHPIALQVTAGLGGLPGFFQKKSSPRAGAPPPLSETQKEEV